MSGRFRPAAGLALVTALMLSARESAAGTVVTAATRQEGRIELQPGAVQVGAARVKWDDVLVMFNEAAPTTNTAPEILQLQNGESWAGSIIKVDNTQAVIQTAFFGRRDLPSPRVRTLDFKAGLPPVPAGETKMLWRSRGSPVPGSLLWVDGDRVALETPLGVLALTRKDIVRASYGGADTNAATASPGDEIALADGSVLSGILAPAPEGLVLKHALLGTQTVKPDAWRWVRRHRDGIVYLADAAPVSVSSTPLINRAPPVPRVDAFGGTETEGAPFIRRIRIWPKTISSYRLPGTPGKKVAVSALVSLAAGARGEAAVRFRMADKVVFECAVAQEKPGPTPVAFETEAGGVLTVEVDFGKVLRFPCSVTLDDAVAVVK